MHPLNLVGRRMRAIETLVLAALEHPREVSGGGTEFEVTEEIERLYDVRGWLDTGACELVTPHARADTPPKDDAKKDNAKPDKTGA